MANHRAVGENQRSWRRPVVALWFLALLAPVVWVFVGPSSVSASSTYSSVPVESWRVNGSGRAVLKIGNTVYVGGSFSEAISPNGSQSVGRSNLAAFDATTGALITSFRADTNASVNDLKTDGTSLFVSGSFTTIGGVARSRVAALDPATGAVRTGFRADANSTVYRMSPMGGRLFVAGTFTSIGGESRTRVAALSAASGAVDPVFNPNVDGTVFGVAATPDGSKVYIGGPYSQVNGVADTDISVLDATTGATSGPALSGVIGYIDDLELTPDGSSLLAAHSGVPGIGNRTSVYDTATGARRWTERVEGDVQGVHAVGEQVFSGFHDGSNGDSATRVALYDLAGGAEDFSFRPSFDRFLGARAVHGDADALVIAGNFGRVSGVRVEGFAIFPAGPPTPIVAAVWGRESWRYLDNGSDQGVAWRQPGFDDSSWRSGIGEFGYGDGGERTVVSYGPDPNNKYITTYFRKVFTATQTPSEAAIYMRIDDGAVVYVNGVEVARDNMPAGPVTYTTRALDRSGNAEASNRYFAIPPSLIVPGANTIALEVHQSSASSADLTFFADVVAYGGGTPPPSTTTTTVPPGGGVDVPIFAVWSYRDDGSDQGSVWSQVGFDDSSWASGVGEFGYGDGDEATVVSFGPDPDDKFATTYFRTEFTADGAPGDLSLTMRIDDGAVAYLNGVEVARFNVPAGPVSFETRAVSAIWGAAEREDRVFAVDPNLVQVGENVLAVSVHQNGRRSSDLSFLASLVGSP